MAGRMGRLRLSWRVVFASCVAAASVAPLRAQEAARPCREGLVLREAFPGDRVCVSPQVRAQVLIDNDQAAARREPSGGAYGPQTCRQGFVWRVARPEDLVCVTPEVRSQTAADNAAASAAASPPSPPIPAPPPAKPAYRLGEWSPFKRQDGVSYRSRWGFDPARPTRVDAIYDIRNMQAARWDGSIRSLDCDRGVLAGSKPVSLAGGARDEVSFSTANCGTAREPFFRPNIVRAGRFD